MKGKAKISERGQVLVLVAVAIIGMLAILALVLDGGNTYAKRRQAQNAADAGALAGAAARCRGTVSDAVTAGYDYAVNRNGADNAVVTVVIHEVTVDTSITYDTFFLSIFGRSQITAEATATAGCFVPGLGQGVLPIAWSCRPPAVPPGSPLDPACEIYFEDEDGCQWGDDPVYVIVDDTDIQEDLVCEDPPPAPGDPPTSGYVDCDLDDDGTNDLDVVSGGNRSWLDLDGGGGGASSLSDWITNGFADPVDTHTWFAGQTGVAVSVYDTVFDEVLSVDKDVVIPVFDQFCGGPPETDCPALVHNDPPPGFTDQIVLSGGSSTDYFHVISFAIFDVTCIDAGSHPSGGSCPGNQQLQDWGIINASGKTIEGCFKTGTAPGLGGGAGGGGPYVGAYVVYLTK